MEYDYKKEIEQLKSQIAEMISLSKDAEIERLRKVISLTSRTAARRDISDTKCCEMIMSICNTALI